MNIDGILPSQLATQVLSYIVGATISVALEKPPNLVDVILAVTPSWFVDAQAHLTPHPFSPFCPKILDKYLIP